MLRRLFCPILAAAVVMAAVLGVADRAAAAIRITMSDGTNEKVFYHSDEGGTPFITSLGEFDVVVQTTTTNYPGEGGRGELVQVISLTDIGSTGGTLPTFTFTSAVIESVDGVSNGQVTDPTQLAAVVGADLLRFTSPSDSQLSVSSQVVGAVAGNGIGTVQNHTEVNGETVSSDAVALNSGDNGLAQDDVPNGVAPDAGYTLSSQVVLSGATVGGNPVVILSESFVTALSPEPGSLAIWGVGALGLAFAGVARRRSQRAKV